MILDWVKCEQECEELLPFCHTTSWETFQEILESECISNQYSQFPPKSEKSTSQDVVYLFYGLPFYIYKTGNGDDTNIDTTDEMPIALIFKPDVVNDYIERVYPFDTGALLADKYKNILKINENDGYRIYQLPVTDGIEIKKLVKRYYLINERYCFGRFNNSLEPCHPKEEKLIRLLRYSSDTKIDLRFRAIEAHSINNIPLFENLLAIVFPKVSAKVKYPDLLKKVKNVL